MALINCKECGREISDKAYSCPNCGCPINIISKEAKETKVKTKDEKIGYKIWIMFFSLMIFIGIIIIILICMEGITNNLKTFNTYTIGKMSYSIPKEIRLTKKSEEKHQFVIEENIILQMAGFYNEINYKLNDIERESWYQSSIEALIGDNSITSNIEEVNINNTIWKKISYSKENESKIVIEYIAFMLLDNNCEYYYAIVLAQPNNTSDEYITILENVMNSITFVSADETNEKSNNFTTVTKENYDKILEGMSKAEVLSILGEPESISESVTPGVGTMELYHFQEYLSLKAIDVYFVNGSVYMKNWTEL